MRDLKKKEEAIIAVSTPTAGFISSGG